MDQTTTALKKDSSTAAANTDGQNALSREERGETRHNVQDISELVIDIKGTTVTCMVHNISRTGAMIETSIRELPSRFILDNPGAGFRKLSRVVWSCGSLTGVEFIKSVSRVQ